MLIVAAQSNKQDFIDEEWVNNEIDPREFGFMIQFCMGVENQKDIKKNKNNNK
jgi:hypothetical protein